MPDIAVGIVGWDHESGRTLCLVAIVAAHTWPRSSTDTDHLATVPTRPTHPESDQPAPPLAGLLVIDLSRVLAGPYAAMMLGDLGARVIKVERPDIGDDTRHWGPPFVGPEGAKESTYFLSINRNKESVVLDFKAPEDFALLEQLVRDADVLIENFRTGVMDRLGLGDDQLKGLNPRLVVLSITGFGAHGPDTQRTGYDQILQGEGGLMSLTGPGPDEPTKVGVPIADILAGMFGAYGVLAALRDRDRTGLGQIVRTSLLAGQIAVHGFQGTRWLVAGEVPEPIGNHHPTVCPYGTFESRDAKLTIAVGNDAIWRRFAPLIGVEPDDVRFAHNADRLARRPELHALIDRVLGERDVSEWLRLLERQGVPAGEVKTLDRVYAAPQVREQGLVCKVEHSSLGPIELPGPPLFFDRSPGVAHRPPPTLGEHTDPIRRQTQSELRAVE
jgi:crotonobetainyl-CoA:carnitine CoA-transferase CaiB-like acyl-CoA transferase